MCAGIELTAASVEWARGIGATMATYEESVTKSHHKYNLQVR